MASDLPVAWDAPHRLWQILRATLCWHIWKDRNEKFFTGGANPEQVIHRVWHRRGTHVRIEWSKLLREIRSGKITILEARDRLAFLFRSGRSGVGTTQDIRIQVPPCPADG